MRLFGRRHEPADEAADEAFDYLTRTQAAFLRRLVRTAFAERGVDVVVTADAAQAQDGRVFGLGNLAAQARHTLDGAAGAAAERRAGREWPGLVAGHVDRVLQAMSERASAADLPRDDVLARTYLRISSREALAGQDWFHYARPLAGDLVEVLALDEPTSVRLLRDDEVEAVGVDDLRAAGLENLLREPFDDHQAVDVGGATLHAVLGESVYTASKLLVLPDVLARTVGDREPEHGVLVAVPFRHQLVFHVLDSAAMIRAVNALAGATPRQFSENPGPVSPFVYWWRPSGLVQLSFPDGEGRFVVRVEPDFHAVMERLAGE